jgi:hypothetical protein
VSAVGDDALGKEKAGGVLARFPFADAAGAAGKTTQDGGPNGALQVENWRKLLISRMVEARKEWLRQVFVGARWSESTIGWRAS